MGATQIIITRRTVTRTRTKKKTSNNIGDKSKNRNQKRCPTCGRYV